MLHEMIYLFTSCSVALALLELVTWKRYFRATCRVLSPAGARQHRHGSMWRREGRRASLNAWRRSRRPSKCQAFAHVVLDRSHQVAVIFSLRHSRFCLPKRGRRGLDVEAGREEHRQGVETSVERAVPRRVPRRARHDTQLSSRSARLLVCACVCVPCCPLASRLAHHPWAPKQCVDGAPFPSPQAQTRLRPHTERRPRRRGRQRPETPHATPPAAAVGRWLSCLFFRFNRFLLISIPPVPPPRVPFPPSLLSLLPLLIATRANAVVEVDRRSALSDQQLPPT